MYVGSHSFLLVATFFIIPCMVVPPYHHTTAVTIPPPYWYLHHTTSISMPQKEETNKLSVEDNCQDLSSESSSDDDSLVLEGMLVRNPEASSSSDDDDEEGEEEEEEEEEEKDNESKDPTAGSKRPNTLSKDETSSKQHKKKAVKAEPEVDMVHVDFVFCDMAEDYWYGLKALLSNSSTLYQAHSSALADQMIEWDMVGTVIGQKDDPESTVFGFATLLHWAHFPEAAREAFSKICQQSILGKSQKDVLCQSRLCQALKTCQEKSSPAIAFLLTGRMINLPIEIVLSLHQQLWLDISWAQTQTTKLSYCDIVTVLCIAPCTRDANNNFVYRYFDDELLAAHAKGSFFVKAPPSFSKEEPVYLHILELDLDGYKSGIGSLETLAKGP